jgi:peptide/nickel transport system permease protein
MLGVAPRAGLSPSRQFFQRLRASPSAIVGGTVIVLFIVIALVGPAFEAYDPLQTALRQRLDGPSAAHWFGTDALGRDILSRLLEGSRVSLAVGVVVGVVAMGVGAPLGFVAGYRGGRTDEILMRLVDVLLALPGLLLAIAIVATLGPGLVNALLAIGIAAVPSFARVARASTLRTKELAYVEAARAIGGSPSWILGRHIVPNSVSPLVILFALRVATGLLTAASLGFLGLGAQPPQPEWGSMLSDGQAYLRSAPHAAMVPGAAILLVVLGFNLLGDGLRDALDPRTKRA